MRIKRRKQPEVYGILLELTNGDEFFIPNKYIRKKKFVGDYLKCMYVDKRILNEIEKYSLSYEFISREDLIIRIRYTRDIKKIYFKDKKIKYIPMEEDFEYSDNIIQSVREDVKYIYFDWTITP